MSIRKVRGGGQRDRREKGSGDGKNDTGQESLGVPKTQVLGQHSGQKDSESLRIDRWSISPRCVAF